jgi:hypothetical protein
MVEPAEDIRGNDRSQGVPHRFDQGINGPRRDGSQKLLDLAEHRLDRVEFRAVWRQVSTMLADYVRGEDVPIQLLGQCLGPLRWDGPRLLTMSDYRTYGRMYVHLVGTLAAWCKDAGLAGLALFFDEFERVDTLSASERLLALEVFRHYAAVLMDRDDLAFDPEHLYRGGHDVHRALPLRFRDELPLVGMFALTPLGDIEASFRAATRSTRYDLRLQPLGRRDLLELVPRIATLYRRAYPDAVLDDECVARVSALVDRSQGLGEGSFRAAVRATVFALDAARCGRLPALPVLGAQNGRR